MILGQWPGRRALSWGMEPETVALPQGGLPGLPPEILDRRDYLPRDQVLELLGIKQQTLYAYVSRGHIRSVPHPDGRSSLYVREDVQKIRSRKREPEINTTITDITPDGPAYRGQLAVKLARSRVPFENVAEFLWDGTLEDEPVIWKRYPLPAGVAEMLAATTRLRRPAHVVQIMNAAVLTLGIASGVRRERIRAGQSPIEHARMVIRAQAGALGFLARRQHFEPLREGETVAEGLVRLLGISAGAGQLDALNAALVVVADHELDPATFAARVAASGSSDLHSCIGAALNTHYGTLVGRTCDRVEALFEASGDPDKALGGVKRLLDAGRSLPGFDHPLYPHGDPRARCLIESAVGIGSGRPAVRNMLMLLSRIQHDYGVLPSVECGLVLLCRALDLPERSASGLYALGRTAGWVAHILEQRLAGFVIRPRARFSANTSGGTKCN